MFKDHTVEYVLGLAPPHIPESLLFCLYFHFYCHCSCCLFIPWINMQLM